MTPAAAQAALLAHPEFACWASLWQQDRQCPLPLADWLRDSRVLAADQAAEERAVAAVWWAWEKEERFVWQFNPTGFSLPVLSSRSCPRTESGGRYCWWQIGDDSSTATANTADEVPLVIDSGRHRGWKTFPATIAYYLAHFDPALAAKYPSRCRAEGVPA